jgi:prepilin peptidase CpaA
MDNLLIIFLGSILIVAAITDLRLQKIPNILTYPAMIMALGYHGVTNGLDGLIFSAGGLALGLALLIFPYLMGSMGAGDVKLMAVVGGTLGARGAFVAFLLICVLGGIYALIVLLIRRKDYGTSISRYAEMLKTLVATGHLIAIPAAKDEKKPKLCYGVAIASGTLFSVFLESSGYVFPI